MDQATARRRVKALLALADPTRGGTPAERSVASAKARELTRKYGLDPEVLAPEPPRRPERTFGAPASGPIHWWFNHHTGAHSANVTVDRFDSYNSWHLTIDLFGPSRPATVSAGSGKALFKPGHRRLGR